MPPNKDNLSDLERHVQLLEANVAKLTQSLSHWQLLEAEYEALGEEVAEVAKSTTAKAGHAGEGGGSSPLSHHQQTELVRIRRDFDGQLVDQKTVSEIFGARPGHSITKAPEQIWGVIDRRLDYVRQNAATLQKQVTAASNRLAAAQVISRPDMVSEEGEEAGGPITDIIEELDDDDNVVNVRLQTPSNTQPHVLEALKKAGIDELPEGKPDEEAEHASAPAPVPAPPLTPKAAPKPTEKVEKTEKTEPKVAAPAPKPAKKGVSFSEDTKDEDNNHPPSAQTPMSHTAKRLDEIMRTAKDQESTFSAETAISPLEESEEDAAMRRDMLEYSMSEIGPIVAQLDIEEATSDEEGFDDDDEEEEDEEDDHGRSKYSVIDEAYRERMRELEKKLGVAPLKNGDASSLTGAMSSSPSSNPAQPGGVGRIRVAGVDAAPLPTEAPAASILKDKSSPTDKAKKKSVSFASALDIAEPEAVAASASASAAVEDRAVEDAIPFVEPLSDVVVERNSPTAEANAAAAATPSTTPAKKKPSRFRMARAEGGAPQHAAVPQLPKGPLEAPVRFLDQGHGQDRRVAPEGPEGKTVVDTIVEREPTNEPQEPDEMDAALLMQETAAEYHRTRNRLIQQQGGFLKANESAVVPLDEEEGGPKRVSKFKAARLSRQ